MRLTWRHWLLCAPASRVREELQLAYQVTVQLYECQEPDSVTTMVIVCTGAPSQQQWDMYSHCRVSSNCQLNCSQQTGSQTLSQTVFNRCVYHITCLESYHCDNDSSMPCMTSVREQSHTIGPITGILIIIGINNGVIFLITHYGIHYLMMQTYWLH